MSKYLRRLLANQQQGIENGPERDDSGNFTRGFKSSWANAKATGKAAIGALTGQEDYLLAGKHDQQAAQKYAGDVESVSDIGSVGDAGDWLAYQAGNAVGSLSQMAIGGGVGGLTGKALAKKLGSEAVDQIAKRGMMTGTMAATYPQQAGENALAMYQEKGALSNEDAGVALAVAGLQSALDVLPVMTTLHKLGVGNKARSEIVQQMAGKTKLGAFGRDVGETMLTEGTTEALQEAMKLGALEWVNANKDHFTMDSFMDIMDSFAAGAVGGAVIGGGPAAYNAYSTDKPWFSGDLKKRVDDWQAEKEKKKQEAADLAEAGDMDGFDTKVEEIKAGNASVDELMRAAEAESQRFEREEYPGIVRENSRAYEQEMKRHPERFGDRFGDLQDLAVSEQKTNAQDDVEAENSGEVMHEDGLRVDQSVGDMGQDLQKPVKSWADLASLGLDADAGLMTAQEQARPVDFGLRGRMGGEETPPNLPLSGEGQQAGFVPAHELPNGTEVVAHPDDAGVWVDKNGDEYEGTADPLAARTEKAVEIDAAAHEAATSPNNDLPEPSQAQKEAGNYKVGRVKLHGLDISVENPKGSQRKGVDRDGKPWSVDMRSHYGYIRGTVGKDKDHLDVFLGDQAENANLPVFVVDQVEPTTGKFDEHKIMMGYPDKAAAKAEYLENYTKDWQGIGAITPMSMDEFKGGLKSGKTKQPVAKLQKKETPPGLPLSGEGRDSAAADKTQFAGNKIFTQDAVEKARARLKKKLSGTQLNSGFDPEILADGVVLAGAYIESGIRSFADYSKAMIADLGDGVRPYLLSFYEGVRHYPGLDTEGMDSTVVAKLHHTRLLEGKSISGERPQRDKMPEKSQEKTGDDTKGETATAAGGRETAQGVGAVDQGAVRDPARPVRERRPAAQQRDAQADSGSVEAGKPADVAEPAERGSGVSGDAGIRPAGSDVGGNGRATGQRNAGDGRKGAVGKEQPDAGAGKRVKPAVKKPEEVSPANAGPGNYHIRDPKALVGGGATARFDKNMAAISLFNQLRDEGRRATRDEQDVLAAYTGWGSFGQELFQGTWENPKPKAGWSERDRQLREHLGESEWKSMQRSITNAHYTDPPTVTAMWKMLERMGFKGGRVLEPSMGIGNFFGLMPPELAARSQLAGIELDQMTGGMAQQLYPDANIKIMGYQESKTPDGFYDLAIGNWPFENTPVADRKYNRLNPFLHDYFFLKTVDQVRPGGLVVAITSKGSMDKKEAKIRRELARKAELVASFRLPTGAFQEYAGTKVVTDIIILRKRAEPISNVENEGWIKSVEYKTPTKGDEPIFVNEYYHNNPQNVIGTIDYGHGTTFKRPGMIVHRPDDMEAQLARIVGLVPEGAFQTDKSVREQLSYVANHTDDREGALTLTDKGFHVVRGEYLAPADEVQKYQVKSEKTTAEREDQFKRLIALRKAYGELIDAERSDTGNAERKRAALRGLYEGFTAEHGGLGDSFGLNYLKRIDDPFYPALAALESDGKPAQILRESTMRGKPAIENPSIEDAFVLARNQAIQPTLAEVAALAGKQPEQVKSALLKSGAVFETVGGDIVPADMYLSGNVREKYRQALAAVEEGQAHLQRNVDALKRVLPKDIPYFNIEVQLGAPWVPMAAYRDYVAHMLGRGSGDGVEVSFKAGRWKARLPEGWSRLPEASTGFGTPQIEFSKLLNAALGNQVLTIRRRDSDGNEYVDEESSKEVNGKIGEMRQKFGDWLWSDPERRVAVEAEYNESRNAYADPVFDGSFLKFEGMALSLGNGPFDLRQHQRNAIWRALVKRKSINAHEVGTGKTFTMGGIAVESRRYGIAKKPLILAHNANSKSVAAEIQMMYPSAKVLYIDNLSPKTIDVKLRQIANDDWDAVVLPHSLIDRLALKEDTMMQMAQAQIDELEDEARVQAQEDGADFNDNMLDDPDELKKLRSSTAKDLVKMRNRIIESIKKQGQRASREGAVSFEDLGIDMVLVDEAHIFKKPPMVTRMRMKGLNVEASSRSIALKFLADYVRNNNNGGNIHTFTGTPVTNTLTEVFHQMRYIMDEEMKDAGVDQWDGWFGSFAKEVEDVELNAAAEYESVVRLAGFINVPELRRMVGQYMDTVFADDMPEMKPRKTKSGKTLDNAGLNDKERAELLNGRTEQAKDRPYKKVIVDTADLTPEQQRAFRKIQGLANQWRKLDKKAKREAMLAGDEVSPIIYEGLATKASFDVRLADGEKLAGKEGQVPDEPNSKASRVVKNVLEVYQSHAKATQVVFTQIGLGTTATRKGETIKVFSTARDIVERLVQGGIPREQIAIVDGSTSKDKRKAIADAMNKAEIRVVIGSTESLGVGVNMQRNLRAMHHMDAPWMPGDLEQRNGRGHRQGNQWNTVLEYRYITDRIDGRRWQVLAVKQRFINAFLKARDDVRVIEGDAASDEESDILSTFAEAAGDPRILIREKLKRKIEQLKDKERLHGHGVADAKRQARRLREAAEESRATLAAMDKAGLPGQVAALAQQMAGDGFVLRMGKHSLETRKAASEALSEWADGNIRIDSKPKKAGTFGGHDLFVQWKPLDSRPSMFLRMNDGSFNREFHTDDLSIIKIENQLRKFGDVVARDRAAVDEKLASAGRAEQVAKEPFRRADELQRAQQDFKELEADIVANPVPPPAWLRSGAPVDTGVLWKGREYTVTGHRWNNDGWFVLAEDDKGRVVIPYDQVMDGQGMPLYEARDFVAPEVIDKKADDSAANKEPDGGWTEADKVPKRFASVVEAKPDARGVDHAVLDRMVNDFLAEYNGNIPVYPIVVENQDEVYGSYPRRIKGAYHPTTGVFTLVASNLDNLRDARETIRHEILGHYGLNTFSAADKRAILEKIIASRNVYTVRKHWEFVERAYPNNSELQNAEEVFAYITESADKPLKLWEQIIDLIVKALRGIGLVQREVISKSEIRRLADSIAKGVREGRRKQQIFPESDDAQFRVAEEARESGPSAVWDEVDAAGAEQVGLWKKLARAVKRGVHEYSKNGGLALLTLRQLAEIGKDTLPAVARYVDRVDQMMMKRNRRMDEAARLGLAWSKLSKAVNVNLSWLMHESTKDGVDASLDAFAPSEVVVMGGMEGVQNADIWMEAGKRFEPVRVEANDANMRLLRDRYSRAKNMYKGAFARDAGLDKRVLDRYRAEYKAMRNALLRDKTRAARYEALRGKFLSLPESAQAVYTQARDLYVKRMNETEAVLLAKTERETEALNDYQRREAMAAIRLDFEQARVQGIYFPLGRAGDYFVRFERPSGDEVQTYRPKAGRQIHEAVDNTPAQTWATMEGAMNSARTRADLVGKTLEAVREGDGWILQDKANEFVFERFDSALAAEEQAAKLRRDGMLNVRQGRLAELKAEDVAGVGEFAAGALGIMRDAGASRDLMDSVYQHYLQFLPSLSMRKQFIHRKKTLGYLNDALNVFARNMLHQAHQLAKLEAGHDLQQILDDVAEQAHKLEGGYDPETGEAADSTLAGNIREEIKLRHQWVMNPENAPWTSWTSAAGFVWYLGASPAAALVNLTQTAVVAYPVLGAKFGFGKAGAALKDAVRLTDVKGMAWEAGKVFNPNDTPELDMALKEAGLSEEERLAFADWQDLGVHDVTMAHMLAGVGDTDSISSSIGYQRAMGKVAHFFQAAEVLNREVTLLAAYRLARSDGMSHEASVKYAANITWESHFDYGNHNRARAMQGNTAKVLLMFKSYSQHMMYHLVRNAYQAGKGDKQASRKLLGTLAVTAALGGVSALPLGMTVGGPVAYAFARAKWGGKTANLAALSVLALWVALALADDEDDPTDWAAEFREGLRSVGGEFGESLMMDGAVNALLGVNLSSRIGLGSLIVRDPSRELEGKDAAMYWIEQAAGPVVGIATKQFTAAGMAADGHWWRGLETALPTFAANPLKSMRYANEGALTMKGAPVKDVDLLSVFGDDLNLWNVFWQSQGFSPQKLNRQYRENSDRKNAEQSLLDRKEFLMQTYYRAYMTGDRDDMRDGLEDLLEFGQKHPALGVDAAGIKRSVAARQRSLKQTRNGIYMGKRMWAEQGG